jgi:hypothetical protein
MSCECCQKIGEFRCPKCKQPLASATSQCALCQQHIDEEARQIIRKIVTTHKRTWDELAKY